MVGPRCAYSTSDSPSGARTKLTEDKLPSSVTSQAHYAIAILYAVPVFLVALWYFRVFTIVFFLAIAATGVKLKGRVEGSSQTEAAN